MEISKELIKILSSIDLKAEMDTSDTIVKYYDEKDFIKGLANYANINTGKKSNRFSECIQKGKRYIFVDRYRSGNERSYLSKYYPEYKVLLFVIYRFQYITDGEYMWEEMFRGAISRDDYALFSNEGEVLRDGEVFPKMEEISKYLIPLCGQFIHENDIESLNNPIGNIVHLPGQSAKEISKFCKGVFVDNYGGYFVPNYRCILGDIIKKIAKHDKYEYDFGIKKVNMDGIRVKKCSIPDEIIHMLGKKAVDCFKTWVAQREEFFDYIFKGTEGSILQNCDGEYVLRTFLFYPCGNINSDEEMPIGYTEIKRVHISDKLLRNMYHIWSPLISFDRNGIEDGVFKYAVKHLEWAEKQTHDSIERIIDIFEILTDDSGTLCFPYVMAFMSSFEKLYNMICSNWENGKKEDETLEEMLNEMRESANCCGGPARKSLEWLIGPINPKKETLHDKLGISKDMLKLLSSGKLSFENIETIKDIFSSHEEFIELLNSKNVTLLMYFIEEAQECVGSEDSYMECLINLLHLFGEKNFKGYISFMSNEYMDKDAIYEYDSYIEKLSVIKDALKDIFSSEEIENIVRSFEWKVKYDDLEKADDAINDTYIMYNDRKNYQYASNCFKEHYREWLRYEYNNGKFAVICPKSPTELVEEGFRLRHCAKNFIKNVAQNQTTIMFIRKPDKLKKPFFTLEIRNNIIRQCHGVNNCNACEYEGLMDFINEYAENKKLKLGEDINRAYGAEQ